MPCTPEELKRLADLMGQGKLGETRATKLDIMESPTSGPGAEVRKRMGVFANLRTQRGAFGDEFQVRVLNPMTRTLTQAMNFRSQYMKSFMDAVAEPLGMGRAKRLMGLTSEQDTQIALALENIDARGNYTGAPGALPDNIIQAGKNVRSLYNDLFEKAGIDPDKYLQGYRRMIKDKPKGLFWDDVPSPDAEFLRGRMGLDEIKFYAELERRGTLRNPNPTASAGFQDYVEGLVRAKQLRPFFEGIEKEQVNPFFDVQMLKSGDRYLTKVNDALGYRHWLKLRDHVFGVPTEGDQYLAASWNKAIQQMGVKGTADTQHLYGMAQAVTNMFYGGLLGSPLGARPASLVRHMFRIVPTWAEFGASDTLSGMKVATTPGSWQTFVDRGIVTAPLEGIHDQVNLARSAGRVISGISQNFLKVFDASDRWIRVATAGAADTRFNRALEEGIEKIRGRREIKDQVISLVKQGQVDRARDEYAIDAVANLQYIYGRANRPDLFRGVVGNAAGVLMAYPFNLSEMYAQFGRRAIRGYREGDIHEIMPAIRQVGFVGAAMMAGSQFLNSDLSSIFLHGAMPASFPVPSAVGHGYMAGKTSAEWALGNVFMTGETDFHKHERVQALKQVGGDLSNLVPGSLFGKEVADVIDDHTFQNLAKHVGFAPLASDANDMARERAKAKIQERRLEGIPRIKGLGE